MNDRNLEDTREPDETEARFCDECGQEMERKSEFFLGGHPYYYYDCLNLFCPSLYDGIEKEMAEKLVETLDILSRVENRVKFLSQRLRKYEKE